jgi:hypothetical protein
MLNSKEINVIGNILNTSWGKCSTERGSFPRASAPPESLTGHLVPLAGPILDNPLDVIVKQRAEGGHAESDACCALVLKYTDLVSFRSDQEAQASMKSFRSIADKRCAAKILELKKEFREKAGRALKVKYKEGHDSVEAIYTPSVEFSLIAKPIVKPTIYRGYYRYIATYMIE